ncbi:BlaI/MecI/CopY family transcriptional regulator [Nonomuraea basaltis]|uniref:BlaI/MecI/CopY family transcriptional regulator n=1 Tax=Nonomuraea basaltis TaxID=2495887 RepID=UPI00110C714B|nr:BlaI/MecI/CopY family transcriptional regulator [Nonomuraea basaltis]TMR93568.1 BlaI/MecI/CopY family transcriptional regulator [Nonomuraea basaltis]
MVRGLGELESAIMDRMWATNAPASVRDVLGHLTKERVLAYTTVMTVMDKLHTKGLLKRKPVGRAYIYEAVSSKEAYTADVMRESLARSGNRAATLVHFLERLTPEEAGALEAALQVCPPRGRSS